ncbi:MAG: hypothetical protein KatS3mg119_0885 [Rhodothalassiaceae bacterium]|nr:MAG: hypothetical protein KatS3mg119_0885 [Rhodothalassiaceae bacterium]
MMSFVPHIHGLVAADAGAAGEELSVPTTTLLPGGTVVAVRIRALKGERFDIWDGESALDEIQACGHRELTRSDVRKARDIAERLGLEFTGTGFLLRGISRDRIPAGIAYVAEAARQWAHSVILQSRKRERGTLLELTEERLKKVFPSRAIARDRELLGASNKRHRFDFVVDLPGDRFAVFETVAPSPVSLSGTHLKFFDLREAHKDWPREAIVADLVDWAAADINLLAQVASHVRDPRAEWDDLAQLAA